MTDDTALILARLDDRGSICPLPTGLEVRDADLEHLGGARP